MYFFYQHQQYIFNKLLSESLYTSQQPLKNASQLIPIYFLNSQTTK